MPHWNIKLKNAANEQVHLNLFEDGSFEVATTVQRNPTVAELKELWEIIRLFEKFAYVQLDCKKF